MQIPPTFTLLQTHPNPHPFPFTSIRLYSIRLSLHPSRRPGNTPIFFYVWGGGFVPDMLRDWFRDEPPELAPWGVNP